MSFREQIINAAKNVKPRTRGCSGCSRNKLIEQRNKYFKKIGKKKTREYLIKESNCDGCDYIKNNICVACKDCAKTKGYFTKQELKEFDEPTQEMIKIIYRKETGYLRDFGCCLPRPMRSFTCLNYICKYDRNKEKYNKVKN